MKLSKLLLASLFLASCQTMGPLQIDPCVILTSGDGWCYPTNGEEEYSMDKRNMMGGYWISPEDMSRIRQYELEAIRRTQ